MAFFVLPAGMGSLAGVFHFRFESVDGILAGVVVFTGLLFALVVHVFTLGLRISDDPRIGTGTRTSRLVDQLQANVMYTVLVGIVATATLAIASGTTASGHKVGQILTAISVAILIHLVLMILMILKRMRAAYREFRR